MQHPLRPGDQAVATFLLHTGQTGEELVGDVLAESDLAETRAGDDQRFFSQRTPLLVQVLQVKGRVIGVVNLADVVIHAGDFEPLAVGGDHAPLHQIVERGAPQHRLLAAGVHGDVATNATGVGAGRVAGPDQPGVFGRFHRAPRDDARFAFDDAVWLAVVGATGQRLKTHRGQRLQLLGVDHRRQPRQRNRAAGVTGTAATRNDGEAELDAAFDQAKNLVLAVGMQHHEGVLHTPVSRIGHVRHTGEAVKGDVVLVGDAAEHLQHPLAQVVGLAELRFKAIDGLGGSCHQFADFLLACLTVSVGNIHIPPFLHLTKAMP